MTGPLLRAAAAAAALAAAAPPALAYVQTTDRGTGAPLAWPLPAVPWHLNRAWPSTAPSCRVTASGHDPTLAAIRASFAEWEQPCTDLRLLYAGESSELRVGAGGSGGNVVLFRRGWCSQHPSIVDPATLEVKDSCLTSADGDCGAIHGCFDDGPSCVGRTAANPCSLYWGIVALTSVLYDPSTGRIMSADIEVNGWDGSPDAAFGGLPQRGWYFTCFPEEEAAQPATCASPATYATASGCAYIDLRNTVTHEVGHFLGLAHPCSVDGSVQGLPLCSTTLAPGVTPYLARTMAPTTSPRSTGKRHLSPDDAAGICAIYPAAPGGCGCGAGGAAGALSLLAAALALRPLGRRRVTRR